MTNGSVPTGRRLRALAPALAAPMLAGCGSQYVVLHPQGPVGRIELRLLGESALVMGVVLAVVYVLFAIVLVRFRETPARRAPYNPDWSNNRWLELAWFTLPVLVLAFIAVPTVRQTFRLAHLPSAGDPLVVDVTSLTWKWLFQLPGQGVATVNYVVIPTGEPVLFRITANSPMNAFWVPALGGMEAAMPGRVLPLWLEAQRPGTYWGSSAQFSGVGFDRMFFQVDAVSRARFGRWATRVRRTAAPLTMAGFRRLLAFGTAPPETYSAYPAATFPATTHDFTLAGGMYTSMAGGTAGS